MGGGVPVVPVRVRGTREVMKKGGKVIYPGSVEVEVCAPIDVAALEGDGESIRERLRTLVTDELVSEHQPREKGAI